MAWRNDPAPESFVFVTVKVAHNAVVHERKINASDVSMVLATEASCRLAYPVHIVDEIELSLEFFLSSPQG
jgi:hypothetical protein